MQWHWIEVKMADSIYWPVKMCAEKFFFDYVRNFRVTNSLQRLKGKCTWKV